MERNWIYLGYNVIGRGKSHDVMGYSLIVGVLTMSVTIQSRLIWPSIAGDVTGYSGINGVYGQCDIWVCPKMVDTPRTPSPREPSTRSQVTALEDDKAINWHMLNQYHISELVLVPVIRRKFLSSWMLKSRPCKYEKLTLRFENLIGQKLATSPVPRLVWCVVPSLAPVPVPFSLDTPYLQRIAGRFGPFAGWMRNAVCFHKGTRSFDQWTKPLLVDNS